MSGLAVEHVEWQRSRGVSSLPRPKYARKHIVSTVEKRVSLRVLEESTDFKAYAQQILHDYHDMHSRKLLLLVGCEFQGFVMQVQSWEEHRRDSLYSFLPHFPKLHVCFILVIITSAVCRISSPCRLPDFLWAQPCCWIGYVPAVNSVPSQLGPSQLGPKSTRSQVNSVPSHLGPKSSRSQGPFSNHGLGPGSGSACWYPCKYARPQNAGYNASCVHSTARGA